MNCKQEKEEKKKQEKNKENNNNNNRAREDVVIEGGVVKIAAYSEAWERGFTTELICDLMRRAKLTPEQCKAWLDYMKDVGWVFTDGKNVTAEHCLRSMRMWRIVDERLAAEKGSGRGYSSHGGAKEDAYEAMKKREALKRAAMAFKRDSWQLCAERCKHFFECAGADEGQCFCRKGRKIPPQLRERPIAPEECEQFEAKEVR